MTQKTNQFNLTTKRYTDADVRKFMEQGWKIWCISVADKFGDNGITGCVMINSNDNDNLNDNLNVNCVEIDTFLLSCRILGKGIEVAFIKRILLELRNQGITEVKAQYVPTAKNAQVKDFYEKCGFACVTEEADGKKAYVLDLQNTDLNIKEYYHINLK